jgi:hypothetical protein
VRVCAVVSVALLVPAVTALAGSAPAAAEVPPEKPLPESNYSVRPACAPPAPGFASCLALQLVPQTAAARSRTHPIGMTKKHRIKHAGNAAEGADGLRPQDLHSGYQLPAEAPPGQTVAIIDAYDDPNAEADLEAYDKEFGLPPCTKVTGCFKKVNQAGNESPLPAEEGGWALEISLDIETTHAVCPNCKILLVEAETAMFSALESAENTAVSLGATEISNSWGGPQLGEDSSAFNHPGVAITASAGDYGYLNWAFGSGMPEEADYPAASPHVVAVGGTRLHLNAGAWESESVWNDGSTLSGGHSHGAGGGGCASTPFAAQPWQRSVPDWGEVGCGSKRAVADVAADADPYSGVAVYDSTPYPVGEIEVAPGEFETVFETLEWVPIGGTSLASPIVASTFALAGGAGAVSNPAQNLYAHLGSASLHDITVGSNGSCAKAFHEGTKSSGCLTAEQATQCASKLICLSAAGFDGPSGVGTPNGIEAFTAPPAPAVSEVSPLGGSTLGGTSVTIKGENLAGPSAVHFGATEATEVVARSATELTVKAPPSEAAGAVDVTVTTAGGTSATSGADTYEYKLPQPPTVTAVGPSEGSTLGGRQVTITGTNFEGASAVKFGEASGTAIQVRSASEIIVRAPAHVAGQVDITVKTPGGTSEEGTNDHFTYVTPPTVTGVSPAEGATAGGTTVKITGTKFEGVSSVDFGGAAATEVNVLSPTEITATSPANVAGGVDVRVTTAIATSTVSAGDRFTYKAPPESPPAGPQLPGAGTSSLTGAPFSSTYVGAPALSTAYSNFNILGQQVNGKTGAVKLTVAVFHRGTLHWTLTYRDTSGSGARCSARRNAGRVGCHATTLVFGEGSEAVGGAKIVSFNVTPSGAAKRALQRALRHRGSLFVQASVSYTATGGGPIAHSSSLSVRLRSHARSHRRSGRHG